MDFISCPRHPHQKIQFLYLFSDNIDILCEDCLQDNIIPSELFKINKLISINTLLQKPETILQKLDLQKDISNAFQSSLKFTTSFLNEQIRLMEKQIQIIQEQIQNILEEFKCSIKNLLDLRKQLLENIMQEFSFDSLKVLLKELKLKDDDTNPDVIEQLKQKFVQYFQFLQKDSSKLANSIILTNIFQAQDTEDQEIQKLQTLNQLLIKLETIKTDQTNIITSIFPQITKPIKSILFSYKFKYKILNLIKQRSNCEINDIKRIYQGSKDGLNGKSFWAQVNGKQNLLMVFKSKSNWVFGGYSPCQWQNNINNYVKDNTNSSFLFSQTHDEVYPIKKDQNIYSIYCNSNYGPTFGGGSDFEMYISTDFQKGYSKLGCSYLWSEYQDKRSSHLFGQEIPQIIECEIFEIQLK